MHNFTNEPCPEWAAKLAITYPEDISPADLQALEAHVKTCFACKAVRDEYRFLDDQIRNINIPNTQLQPKTPFWQLQLLAGQGKPSAPSPSIREGVAGSTFEPISERNTSGNHVVIARYGRNRRKMPLRGLLSTAAMIVFVVGIVGSFFLFSIWHSHAGLAPQLAQQGFITVHKAAAGGEIIGLSDGRFVFDTRRADGNLKLDAAAKYRSGDATSAESLWQEAVQQDQNDAEALIYLENLQVLNSHRPYITIVIATILTGDHVGVGRDDLQGAYIAQKNFNDRFRTVQVRLLIANSGSIDESNAAIVAQQIVQAAQADKTIVGVIGWPLSQSTLNAIPILQASHIPMVSESASTDLLTGISPYFFRISPSNKSYGKVAATYVEQTLHAKRVVLFVAPGNPYSSNLASDFQQPFLADGNGNHIVATENYTVGTLGSQGQLSALLQDALNHNPDLIYFSGYPDDAKALLANLPTTGPFANLPVMGGEALYELSDYSNTAGFNRLHFTAAAYPDEWNVAGLESPTFFSEYSSTFNPDGLYRPGIYGYTRASSDVILSYDATLALLTGSTIALTNNGNGSPRITPEELQQALTTISIDHPLQGVSGEIAFDSNGDPVNKAIVVLYGDINNRFHEATPPEGCLLIGHCS